MKILQVTESVPSTANKAYIRCSMEYSSDSDSDGIICQEVYTVTVRYIPGIYHAVNTKYLEIQEIYMVYHDTLPGIPPILFTFYQRQQIQV